MKGKRVHKIGTTKAMKKGVYKKYSFETRKKLILMVVQEKRTLASSAKELGICQTTARLIVSTWRAEQRVFEKKSEREKRVRKEAKRKAHERRRERTVRQRQEANEEILEEEQQLAVSSLKIEDGGDNCPSEDHPNAFPATRIAEDPEGVNAQMLPVSMVYQFMDINGNCYLQPFFYAVPASGFS